MSRDGCCGPGGFVLPGLFLCARLNYLESHLDVGRSSGFHGKGSFLDTHAEAVPVIEFATFNAASDIHCAGSFLMWALCAAMCVYVASAYLAVVKMFWDARRHAEMDNDAYVIVVNFVQVFAWCQACYLFYIIKAFWPCNLLWAAMMGVAGTYAWLLVVRLRRFGIVNLLRVLEYGGRELRALRMVLTQTTETTQTTQTEAMYLQDEQFTDEQAE